MSQHKFISCPNHDCKPVNNEHRVYRIGHSRPVKCAGGTSRQRYRCKNCGKRFSENVYSLYFRSKKPDPALYSRIFSLFVEGMSNRRIARFLGISANCVAIRLNKLSQHGLDFHQSMLEHVSIREALCIDGLENFAGSQYEPNNINQAIGQNSLFVYDFNFAPLNRKGRMSGWQKGWLRQTEMIWGSFNKNAIRHSFADLVKRLDAKRAQDQHSLNVITDRHFQYRRAIQNELRHLKINHLTISSKAHRDYKNILFPVNHLDLFIRERVAAFRRETISFSKTPGKMVQKYALYIVYKNYMCEQFTKKQRSRPEVHLKSPAQAVGLSNKILTFAEVFAVRSSQNPKLWNNDWQSFHQAQVPARYARSTRNNQRKIRPLLAAHS